MSNRVFNHTKAIHNIINEQFSGAIYIKDNNDVLFESAFGYANRADQKLNTVHTRFGIASGCKLFTAVAICQLVEKGFLSFETRLEDCLNIQFPHFSKEITIHHLLTHSSGIPDYFDEQVMENFEDLWKQTPMYLLNDAKDFLPLFQNGEMMFHPGEKFHYNNAGFIVLGLIVEQQSGLSFTDYIEANLFQRCRMNDSGYFSLDRLPKNTAYGYIDNKDGTWRTNTYSIPIKGGADGGAFITPSDMIKFWKALFNHQLLSKEYTDTLLHSQIHVKDGTDYGYGLWISKSERSIIKYHVMGYDPGVSFHSAFYPKSGIMAAILSNKSSGAFEVMKGIEEIFEI
ncbi:serine hydrolase [Paenibacillus sp. 102]|uniref:serine hydrolase domain-containing protein n=1 Tax=Paenibacillus sp. 102 TaxID=3120823 RepID=UPI0031BB5DC1